MNLQKLFPTVEFISVSDAVKSNITEGLLESSALCHFADLLMSYSKLPTRISSEVIESLLEQATGGFRLGNGGKIDVCTDKGECAYQIKKMAVPSNSAIWGRVALPDKLDMIPASKVSPEVRQMVANTLLNSLLAEFNAVLDNFGTFVYMQVMEHDRDMYLIISELDQDLLNSYLTNPCITWRWTEPTRNKNRYPSLSGFVGDRKVFAWNGLSGNHFNIVGVGYFLERVSSRTIGIKVPLSVTQHSISDLAKILG